MAATFFISTDDTVHTVTDIVVAVGRSVADNFSGMSNRDESKEDIDISASHLSPVAVRFGL